MSAKPIFKRLKYKNILIILAVVVVVIIFVVSAKNAGDNDNSSSLSESSSQGDNSSKTPDSSSDGDSNINTEPEKLPKNSFTYIKATDSVLASTGTLVIIDGTSQYKGEAPTDLLSSYDYMFNQEREKLFKIKDANVKAKLITLEAVNKMMSGFSKEYGTASMVMMNGYESSDLNSELSTGYSVNFLLQNSDSSYSDFNAVGSYEWIAKNCYTYGLIQRYPEVKSAITGVTKETGVFRYVGLPHAQIMTKNNLVLEEYIELIKKYSYSDALCYTTDDKTDYAIYYVAAQGETTNIQIPTNSDGSKYPYEISGDNKGGYIVTVKLP